MTLRFANIGLAALGLTTTARAGESAETVSRSCARALAAGIALAAVVGCQPQDAPASGESTAARYASAPAAQPQAPVQHSRDTTFDTSSPTRPDPRLTPGATFPVTAADICTPGYSRSVRNVPTDVKKQAYAEYGITRHGPGAFEVDHLISLELGGSNSIKNLWPESYHTEPWNARVKDALENRLHQEVCAGKTSLAQAQHEIATDWIAAYKSHFHRDAPLPHRSRAASPARRR